MSAVAFGRTVRLATERASSRSDFRIGLEAIEKETGRLNFDPDVQYDGDGIRFRRGDVLFGKLRPNLRKAWLADADGDAVGDFHVYRPLPERMTSRYLSYLVLSEPFLEPVIASVSGAKMPRADWNEVRNVKVWVPSLSEQQAIADYLDRETAQIDAFIAKNEELITLLTERRRATIGSAVTRGIRRDAPTRPSGVAWLGDVPSHWSVTGLARYAGTVSGVGFPESEQGIEDAEIAFYKVNSLGQADVDGVIRKSWDTISRDTARYLRAKILPPGTILLAKIGAALLLGRIRRTDRPACIDNNMMAIVPNEHLNARFASYALQTFDFETLANPGTVPSMDMYALMHRETAVPPLVEQEEIADYLDRRLAGIDAALATCRRGIDLARERRAALISAAVTGKIDVGVAA